MPEFQFFDLKPRVADIRSDVLAGLQQKHKAISPKFFYDHSGSKLFEAITELPEYYLTRTEMGLFDKYGPAITQSMGTGDCLVEYGSGSSLKIRKMLSLLQPSAYMPIDISKNHLLENAQALFDDYSGLSVYPTCADFSAPLVLPAAVSHLDKVGFFPGSSIGNFDPDGAAQFLRNVCESLGTGGRMLLGVDRKKSTARLEAAYNDSAGVTAAFNLNLLVHLNELLGANFVTEQFAHDARYDSEAGCICMYLRSLCVQSVNIGDQTIEFAVDEEIHTENSYKYHPEEFTNLSRRGGFEVSTHWTDAEDLFSVFLLQVEHLNP